MPRVKPSAADRRQFFRQSLGLGLMSYLEGPRLAFAGASTPVKRQRKADTRFMIVMQGSGGASIIDSFMALREEEVTAAGGDPTTLNCFNAEQVAAVAGSPFKAVNFKGQIATLGNFPVAGDQLSFAKKHLNDMLCVTLQGTSITHPTAQKRSVTGNEAWAGRTLQEVCAATYGGHLPIANLMLGSGGFVEAGVDASLPRFARGLTVSDSRFWSAGLSRSFGLAGAPSEELLGIAKEARDQLLDAQSLFFKTFKDSSLLTEWVANRGAVQQTFIDEGLAPDLAISGTSQDAKDLRQLFPDFLSDDLEAQAILACLAITQDVSCAVTLGPSFAVIATGGLANIKNPPIAFDFSHADHRAIQAMMWQRLLGVVDRMADFLKSREFAAGQSFWDRSMVYVATDFGRSKKRPAAAQSFSSGHDLNNGVLILSPLAKGNQVLGGVDPVTAQTYGFDPASGAPEPHRSTQEKELYCGLLQIMGVDTGKVPGAVQMSAMVKRS